VPIASPGHFKEEEKAKSKLSNSISIASEPQAIQLQPDEIVNYPNGLQIIQHTEIST
jgi:hypothetical protein